MINYDVRSAERTVKKFCAKCKLVGWFRPGERKCRRLPFGKLSAYWCYGNLNTVATVMASTKTKTTVPPQVVDSLQQRGDTFRAKAEKALAKAEKAMVERRKAIATEIKKHRQWIKNVHKQIARWELRATSAQTRTRYSDAAIEEIRQRAIKAARVRNVRRRLMASTGDEPAQYIVRAHTRRSRGRAWIVQAHYRSEGVIT